MKEFLYIVQAKLESTKCKIGITNNLERRLKEYNAITGKSKDNAYAYLFTCEVANMREIEKDIKLNFSHLREQESREIYFYNEQLFEMFVSFIKAHRHFIKEIFLKPSAKEVKVKIVQKPTPSLGERGITAEQLMKKARRVKNDEFYTRYEDIEKEIAMYPKEIWHDKIVFCNCDDAVGETRTYKDSSAFALYFIKNFFELKLKKLICTHYGTPTDLFNAGKAGYIFTKSGVKELFDTPKNFTGSFDSPLCLEILNKEADIVCTNPPFSRMREYWKILIESKKKFLIISAESNVVTKAYIHYFAKKQVWAGYYGVDWFLNPKREPVQAAGHWFCNLTITERPRHKNLKILPLDEIPEKYKTFDDNETLLVGNNYIPNNYDKPFAVSTGPILNGILEKGFEIVLTEQYIPYLNNKAKFARVLIQNITKTPSAE